MSLWIVLNPIFAKIKTDDQLWYGIQFKKSIDNIKFEISQENRFEDDLKIIHKSLTEFSISYKFNDLLNLSTQYRNIQYDDKFKSRIAFSNKIGYSINQFDFGIKTKMQKDYLNNKNPEELVIKNKFSIEFNFLPFFAPYFSHELYHDFINNNLDFKKFRTSIGIEYDVSKIFLLKLFYTYDGEFDQDEFEIKNIIGLKYEITI